MKHTVLRPLPVPAEALVPAPPALVLPEGLAFAGHGARPQVLHVIASGPAAWRATCGIRVPFAAARHRAWPEALDAGAPRLCPACAADVGLAGHPLAIDELSARLWRGLPAGELDRDRIGQVGLALGFSPASIGHRLRALEKAGLVERWVGEDGGTLYQRLQAPSPRGA